jgi:AsmA protein
MLRKMLIGVFAVVALATAGAVALLAFFDVNRFKPHIEQAAQERLQRRLAIDGDLSLSVFPRLAVRLPRTTLSERDGKGTLLSLDSARVGVALLPLLSGRVEVDRIRIDGLSAQVRRAAGGSTSIDDLLRTAKTTGPDANKTEAKPIAFDIGGIELVDAEFRLIEPAGTTTLSKLRLQTGRIAPGVRLPVTASTQFALPSKIAGEARLAAALDFDPPRRAYGAEGVALEVKGRIGGDEVEAKLTAPKLRIEGDSIRGDSVALTIKRGGVDAADAKLNVAAFDGSTQALRTDRIEVAANLRQGARRIVATLASPAQASLDAQTLALPKLAGTVTVDDPALPMKSLKLTIDGALALDARKQSVGLRADSRFDDTALNAKVDIDNFARPQIGFDVKADRFDLDRYAPPAAEQNQAAAAGGAPAKIDLAALRTLNANGQVALGELKARGLKASGVRIGVKAANGRADIAPIAAQLYGGTLNGTARAAADGNRVGLDATLANVALGPLLKDLLKKEPIEGRGNVRLALAAGGATVDAMKRGLDGSASLRMRDGAVRGIDIVRKLRDARALILGGRSDAQKANTADKTDFSELNVSFAIKDGVAASDDLDLKSPLLSVGGAGRIDIGAGAIDYTARVATTGALAELRGVTVPVRLSGPFDQLTYNIDWGGVAREAVKSRLIDDQRKNLEQRARDALKGLLGR